MRKKNTNSDFAMRVFYVLLPRVGLGAFFWGVGFQGFLGFRLRPLPLN